MLPRTPHLQTFCAWSIVRIDEHGSKDRAKDASPNKRLRSLVPSSGACAWWRMLTTFPSSASFGHPLSSARPLHGRNPRELTDRSRPAFRRRPAKSATFPSTRMPFTITTREGIVPCEGIAPSDLRAGSLARAAHTLSPFGAVLFDWALRGHGAVTRGSVTGSRVQTPL